MWFFSSNFFAHVQVKGPPGMENFFMSMKEGSYNLWIFERNWGSQWCWIINKVNRLKAKGERDGRRWEGWMASLTPWTWISVNSGRYWRTEEPDMLQSMGSQSWTWLSDWTTTTKMLLYLRYRFRFKVLQVKIGSEGDVISVATIYDTAWFSHM